MPSEPRPGDIGRRPGASARERDVVPRSFGLCMLRNCADIVPYLCGHYLRMGLERIQFIDDQSTDGTFAFLNKLSRSEPRIRVRAESAPRDQAEVMTEAANAAIAQGFRIVVPFDADEFWAMGRADLASLANDPEPRVIRARWVSFVQRRGATRSRPGTLLRMCHRIAEGVATSEDVMGFRDPFIAHPSTKVAVISDRPVDFFKGQHELNGGPNRTEGRIFELFHVPFRNRGELVKRALDYHPRRVPFRVDATESWQAEFHAAAYREGRIDAVWAANSVDRRGFIDVYGDRRPAIRDLRLFRFLVAASLYMLVHHRVLVL